MMIDKIRWKHFKGLPTKEESNISLLGQELHKIQWQNYERQIDWLTASGEYGRYCMSVILGPSNYDF